MTNKRIFKIKDSVHEEFWIVEKDDEGITNKRYVYGVLSHKDFLTFAYLKDLKINYQNLTLEEIIKIPNPVRAYYATIIKNEKYIDGYKRNEELWEIDVQKINEIITNYEDISDKAWFFDTLGIVEIREDRYEGKCIVKGFKTITEISINIYEDTVLTEKNEILKKIIENYRKDRESILENLKKNYDEIKADYEKWIGKDDGTYPFIRDIFEFEQYLDFRDIVFWQKGICIYANVPWDEEHGVELEFDNNGNFIFQ